MQSFIESNVCPKRPWKQASLTPKSRGCGVHSSLEAVWPGQTSLCSWDKVTRSLLDGSFPLFCLVAQTVPPPAWPIPSQGSPRGQERACRWGCYTRPNSGKPLPAPSSFESSGVIFVCRCYCSYYYFGINRLEEWWIILFVKVQIENSKLPVDPLIVWMCIRIYNTCMVLQSLGFFLLRME